MTMQKSRVIRLVALAVGAGLVSAVPAGAAAGGQQSFSGVRSDTLRMTCDEATRLLKSAGSAVLSSGPNKYDLYHADGSACAPLRQDATPAWVVTQDAGQCFIGYTCTGPEDRQPDNDR